LLNTDRFEIRLKKKSYKRIFVL